jgi:phospholipid-translocating ATPase
LIQKDEYFKWKELFDKANEKLDNREEEVRKVVSLMELNMEFLGITGVEDKL